MRRKIKKLLEIISILVVTVMAGCGSIKGSADGAATGTSGTEAAVEQKKAELDEVSIEKDARVSFLGPAGTYTEEAAILFFGGDSELLPEDTVDEAIQALNEGNADYAVIPQENNILHRGRQSYMDWKCLLRMCRSVWKTRRDFMFYRGKDLKVHFPMLFL